MDLKEVVASPTAPYRCYVRGSSSETEGANVHTLGFRNGAAVVEAVDKSDKKADMADIKVDSKMIDLTKLKKIIVKIDPVTGRKYIVKDGKKIEVLSQVSAAMNLKSEPNVGAMNSPNSVIKRGLVIKSPLMLNGQVPKLVSNGQVPKLIPVSKNVKILENGQFKLFSQPPKADSSAQTDDKQTREVETQTDERCETGEFTEGFLNFILGDKQEVRPVVMERPSTKEDIRRFTFFNDMRNALILDRSGNLPIHDSVIQNNLKMVQKNCIILQAIKESVNLLNEQNYTPLHLAVLHDVSIDILKTLINHNADLGLQDPDGNTAIHLAVEHRRFQMLKHLINGAVDARMGLDSFNHDGFTPLITACMTQSYDEAKLLLQYGANPNVKDMKSGRTALFHAAEAYDVNLVELLIHHRADTKNRNFFGTSPHDAMFELDEMPLQIKFLILGREHQRLQSRKKGIEPNEPPVIPEKKAKLHTTPILKKVTTDDLLCKKRRK